MTCVVVAERAKNEPSRHAVSNILLTFGTLLPFIYAPMTVRSITFGTTLHICKSVYRHFGSVVVCSTGPQAAGIWAEDGAHEKGPNLPSFRNKNAAWVLRKAARPFVLSVHV